MKSPASLLALVPLVLALASCQSAAPDPVLDYMMYTKPPLHELSVKAPAGDGWKTEKKGEDMVAYARNLPSGAVARTGLILHYAPGTARTASGLRKFMDDTYKVVGTEKYKGRAMLLLSLPVQKTPKGPGTGEEVLLFYENSKAWILQIYFSEVGSGTISPETRKAGMQFRQAILDQLKG